MSYYTVKYWPLNCKNRADYEIKTVRANDMAHAEKLVIPAEHAGACCHISKGKTMNC